MVTNLDIIVKKYPEVVKKCLSVDTRIAIDKNTGKATLCNKIACENCIFSGTYDGVICNRDKIKVWLSKEVNKVAGEVKESELIDNSNNTRNSNGEITW